MKLSKETWRKYQQAHAVLQGKAKQELERYFDTLPWLEDEAESLRLLRMRAIALAERYGIADGELSAQLYDELMAMQGAIVEPAEIAEVDAVSLSKDVTKVVDKGTSNVAAKELASNVVSGYVKRVGIETMEKAARRDGASWAWVCIGDTCAFCRMLGSRGWQDASKSIRAGNHATHIHSNCDCQFVVKPSGAKLEIDGYDPDALYREYADAEGKNAKDKLNAMRREGYTKEYADWRNARRRELYADMKAEQAELGE